MLLVYLFVLVGLWLTHLVLRWRVARLERRFVRVATQADALLHQIGTRPGNSNKVDPLKLAQNQYELAQFAYQRDRVEKRYENWQLFSERFTQFRRALSNYQGKVVPYVFGLLDLATLVVVLETLGINLTYLKAMAGM